MTTFLTFQSLVSLAQYYLAKRDHSTYELTNKLTKYCLSKTKGTTKDTHHSLLNDETLEDNTYTTDLGFSRQDFELNPELFTRIEEVIFYCQEHRWLDDRRFTQNYIASQQKKGEGKNKLKQRLYQKGIHKDLINQCLNESDTDWFELARLSAEKKFKIVDFNSTIIPLKEKAKIARFLQARGFSFDEINAIFD